MKLDPNTPPKTIQASADVGTGVISAFRIISRILEAMQLAIANVVNNNADYGSFTTLASKVLSMTGLIDLSDSSAGQIKFPATQNPSTDANTLDDYTEYTAASTACTGAITTSVIWKATKAGNKVTLTLPGTTGSAVAAAAIVYGATLPTNFRPSVPIVFPALVRDNGVNQSTIGMITITSAGVISIYKDPTGASFTNASTCGIAQGGGTGLSWTI